MYILFKHNWLIFFGPSLKNHNEIHLLNLLLKKIFDYDPSKLIEELFTEIIKTQIKKLRIQTTLEKTETWTK